MTETSEIGPPFKRRRGVAPGTFLIWITLAAVGGAIVWGIYGNDVRSILKLPPAGAPAHWVSTQTNQNQSMMKNADEIVGCESARGPDADRHVKLLIQFAVEGSLSGAYSHHTLGHKAKSARRLDKVRFTPDNGHRTSPDRCPLSADIVAKVENRTTLKISRKLMFGLLCCCGAFQRHDGGP